MGTIQNGSTGATGSTGSQGAAGTSGTPPTVSTVEYLVVAGGGGATGLGVLARTQ